MFFSKYESRFQDFMIPNLVSGAYDYVNNITSDSFIDKISKNWIYATQLICLVDSDIKCTLNLLPRLECEGKHNHA